MTLKQNRPRANKGEEEEEGVYFCWYIFFIVHSPTIIIHLLGTVHILRHKKIAKIYPSTHMSSNVINWHTTHPPPHVNKCHLSVYPPTFLVQYRYIILTGSVVLAFNLSPNIVDKIVQLLGVF